MRHTASLARSRTRLHSVSRTPLQPYNSNFDNFRMSEFKRVRERRNYLVLNELKIFKCMAIHNLSDDLKLSLNINQLHFINQLWERLRRLKPLTEFRESVEKNQRRDGWRWRKECQVSRSISQTEQCKFISGFNSNNKWPFYHIIIHPSAFSCLCLSISSLLLISCPSS